MSTQPRARLKRHGAKRDKIIAFLKEKPQATTLEILDAVPCAGTYAAKVRKTWLASHSAKPSKNGDNLDDLINMLRLLETFGLEKVRAALHLVDHFHETVQKR